MMRWKKSVSVFAASVLCLTVLQAQVPVILEAESGTQGAEFATRTDGAISYVTITTNLAGGNPVRSERVISYEVTFEEAGTYDLYARIRVGASAFDDDSFFYGNGFGAKSPSADGDWVRANGLSPGGYAGSNNVVNGDGGAGNQVWKWINLSLFTADAPPITFTVEEGALTQTFQIGAREDGLDFDKFAFGRSGWYYTVDNLDNGEAGSETPPDTGTDTLQPLARNADKWLGSAYSNSQALNFEKYWNQVTPENSGKWGSVEGQRDVYNWGQLDQAYNLAKENGFKFRFHVLLWGAQQPQWIRNLPAEEQLEEIIEWMDAVAERYPDIDYLEVVNEPINDPPSADHPGNQNTTDYGGYIDALGGTGETGWDWIRTAFRLAKERFPNAQLVINEYSIVNTPSRAQQYIEIVEILQEEDLIDIIGVQAHAFSTTAQASTMTTILNQLAETGLKIQATELDIDGVADAVQLASYQRIFPVFWNHPAVMGVTLWGWRPGLWRNDQGAYLINPQGEERPAMKWLREFVESNGQVGGVLVESITVRSSNSAYGIVTPGGTLQMIADVTPENASNKEVVWSVNNTDRASISETGLLTALANGGVVVTATAKDNSGVSNFVNVSIANQTSALGLADQPAFQIFPNPVDAGQVQIQAETAIQLIQIYDLSGQALISVKGNKTNRQQMRLDLKSGVYLLTVVEEERTTSQRLLVK